MNSEKIIYKGGTGEIIEKKSRFIACVTPVSSEEEASTFIAEVKKRHRDAAHNCYAFSVGDKGELCRASDDGEPSGTAGRPILDVINGEAVRNVCIVVTRYFGGTLLGTGGLVRAYSAAAKEGLLNSVFAQKVFGTKIIFKIDYHLVGKVEHLASEMGVLAENVEYTDIVTSRYFLTDDLLDSFCKKISDTTAGQVVPTVKERETRVVALPDNGSKG